MKISADLVAKLKPLCFLFRHWNLGTWEFGGDPISQAIQSTTRRSPRILIMISNTVTRIQSGDAVYQRPDSLSTAKLSRVNSSYSIILASCLLPSWFQPNKVGFSLFQPLIDDQTHVTMRVGNVKDVIQCFPSPSLAFGLMGSLFQPLVGSNADVGYLIAESESDF